MKHVKKFEDTEWIDAITELEDDDLDVSMDTEVEDDFSEMLYGLVNKAKEKLGKSKVLNLLDNLKRKI